MKEAKKKGEVLALMPSGSNEQLQIFLDNLSVEYKFFNAHTDTKPAKTIKRKFERHWNKLYCEFVLIKCLKNLDFKDSVTHIELAPWQSFMAIFWLCSRTKVFITIHNSVLPIPKSRYLLWHLKFRILALNKNFHLFTANEDAKRSLKSLVPKKFFENITVTYANVNPFEIKQAFDSELNREKLAEKYHLPADKFLVFCVGQFIDRKGRWIFLEAAEKLLKIRQDICFVWISNSKPNTEDLEKARNYQLNDNFIFITSDEIGKQHVDLFKLLRLAAVFVLPSYLEGLPISILEAMALGIPTVSTNINGIPEAIKHLETGYLIEPGSSDALMNAVLEIKNDERLREKLSKNGREYVLNKFNENAVAQIALERYSNSFDE